MKLSRIERLRRLAASTAILVALGAIIKYVIDRRYPI